MFEIGIRPPSLKRRHLSIRGPMIRIEDGYEWVLAGDVELSFSHHLPARASGHIATLVHHPVEPDWASRLPLALP
jgi:hypothetical protein